MVDSPVCSFVTLFLVPAKVDVNFPWAYPETFTSSRTKTSILLMGYLWITRRMSVAHCVHNVSQGAGDSCLKIQTAQSHPQPRVYSHESATVSPPPRNSGSSS